MSPRPPQRRRTSPYRGIAEPDPPAGEPAVDLVFHLADGDDGVRGYGALDLKQEIRIELLLRDPPDLPGL